MVPDEVPAMFESMNIAHSQLLNLYTEWVVNPNFVTQENLKQAATDLRNMVMRFEEALETIT